MNDQPHSCHCPCCVNARTADVAVDLNRRDFLFRVGAVAAATGLSLPAAFGSVETSALPRRGPMACKSLKVQPVLTYDLPKRREATSWRNWGGVQTEEQARAEQQRIENDLAALGKRSDFELDLLPVRMAHNLEQAAAIAKGAHDVTLVYAAGGTGEMLEQLFSKERWNLMFLRHDPGPVYLWYEIAHPRFLRKTVDEYGPTGMDVNDVVVDEHGELLPRLRGLYGLKNALGKRIVAIGGASGWGAGGRNAPDLTKKLWKMEIVDYPYSELEPRLKAAMGDTALVSKCAAAAHAYLRQSRVTLHTARGFVENAFVLGEVFKDVMDEAKTDAITINQCMGTIMGISKTTACLPLSLLNDDGYLAFCESDFVVIPSGILLHYISGKPVFLNDPTYPHADVVTLAHCTAPRKMDGKRAERTKILTHFESDYGAAPKVEMKLGQVCTNLVPDFASQKWVGFAGTIVGNPFLDICRSQIDVKVKGDSLALLREMKGFHWMMSYGDYLKECGYALGKVGVGFHDVSAPKAV